MAEKEKVAAVDGALRDELGQLIGSVLREELDAYLQKQVEGHFYQNLVMEMKGGIGDVYHSIADFKKDLGQMSSQADSAETLIGDASDQLEEIVKTTESATNRIMDIVETFQDLLTEMSAAAEAMPAAGEGSLLQGHIRRMQADTMEIMTACSFQDITGQRVRKVVDLIRGIEKRILEMMVSSGVKIKEKREGKDEFQIADDAHKAVDLLQGPDSSVGQENVDDLLASLGL
ncbi:protein phosphatase CheZ [Thermodesulfobacteriota bacterium]